VENIGNLIPFFAILLGISIPITAIRLKHKEKLEQIRMASGGNNNGVRDSAHIAQQDAKIELLEDRLVVLERIVTDRSYELAHQIEALRDNVGVPLGLDRQPATSNKEH
jgi:hypothetical protein